MQVKVAQSYLTFCNPGKFSGNSPGHNIRVGSLSFLQGIFITKGLNPGIFHHRQILYQLSHKGSPTILEWVTYPYFSGSSWPRNQTGVSCIAGIFFTNWVIREAQYFNLKSWNTDNIKLWWGCGRLSTTNGHAKHYRYFKRQFRVFVCLFFTRLNIPLPYDTIVPFGSCTMKLKTYVDTKQYMDSHKSFIHNC